MTRTTALSLALLLACSALAAADGQCGSAQFQCVDGSKCLPAGSRCNGINECTDSSDEAEEVCDGGFPKVALPANGTVSARLQFKREHEAIELHLCGEEHCSMVWLGGVDSDGALAYITHTGCPYLGHAHCSSDYSRTTDGGYNRFTPGEVVLVAQHRPGWLAVWREGRPDAVAEVPVDQEEDYGTLRVRPLVWSTDMSVDFTDSSGQPITEATLTTEASSPITDTATTANRQSTTEAAATTRESAPTTIHADGGCGANKFQCTDGSRCIWAFWRCDGHNECRDGSDEAEELCDASNGCAAGLFRCKDGSKCIQGYLRCQGHNDCADGSDEVEEICDGFPKVALPANTSVRARVQYKQEHADIWADIGLNLCGAKHCSTVWLHGTFSDGALAFDTYIDCPYLGWDCWTSYSHYNSGYEHLTASEVVLEVQHRPGWLAVWREGRLDDVVEVPVDREEEYSTLRVRPFLWATDMPVDFTDSSGQPTTTEAAGTTQEQSSTEPTATEESSTTTGAATPTQETSATTEAAGTTVVPSSSSAGTTGTDPASSTEPTAAPWPPVPAPASCTPDMLSLLIPVAGDCNKYVVCYSGRSQEMPCPGVLAFNYQLQTCDWPANVACSP